MLLLVAILVAGSSAKNTDKGIENDVVNMLNWTETILPQIMMNQFYQEERVRADGQSGIKAKRFRYTGTRPYHSDSFTNQQIMYMHDRANLKHTVGLGEIDAVLNGLEFRTRHADYGLYQPSTSTNEYNAVTEIPLPDVPPPVTSKGTVAKQINEMKLWFKAWKDQDYSVRDFRPYFKPVLCYLEGEWIHPQDYGIEEPFENDLSYIVARSYYELHRKARWMAYTGSKNNEENYSFQPISLLDMINDTTPVWAQWAYQIRCHPLNKYVYTNRLRVVDDLAARLGYHVTLNAYANTRGARFTLNPDDSDQFLDGYASKEFLDDLMGEIPGKDNYGAQLEDDALFNPSRDFDNSKQSLNAAYYHRWFRYDKKGAAGFTERHRGFADNSLFMAMNTRENVTSQTVKNRCQKDIKGVWSCKDSHEQKWSYAIPLEIIYLTPLGRWNPHNIRFEAKSPQCPQCNGGFDRETAFTHASDTEFYLTPSEFFTGKLPPGDASDTSRKEVGILDGEGNVRRVWASGVHAFLPEIEGLGKLRTRYPIAPVHQEGSAVWKELKAFKDLLVARDSELQRLREELGIKGPGSTNTNGGRHTAHVHVHPKH